MRIDQSSITAPASSPIIVPMYIVSDPSYSSRCACRTIGYRHRRLRLLNTPSRHGRCQLALHHLEAPNLPRVVDRPAHHLVHVFSDDERIPINQGDNGVRRGFDHLDQLGVNHHHAIVQSGYGNHVLRSNIEVRRSKENAAESFSPTISIFDLRSLNFDDGRAGIGVTSPTIRVPATDHPPSAPRGSPPRCPSNR